MTKRVVLNPRFFLRVGRPSEFEAAEGAFGNLIHDTEGVFEIEPPPILGDQLRHATDGAGLAVEGIQDEDSKLALGEYLERA